MWNIQAKEFVPGGKGGPPTMPGYYLWHGCGMMPPAIPQYFVKGAWNGWGHGGRLSRACRAAACRADLRACLVGPPGTWWMGPPAPAAAKAVLATSTWGIYRFYPKQASAQRRYGGFQAVCPLHRVNDKTKCTKYLACSGPGDEEQLAALRRLMFWCSRGRLHDRAHSHQGDWDPHSVAVTDEDLEALVDNDFPAERPWTDAALDILDAGAPPAALA